MSGKGLVERVYNDVKISRRSDGYWNATAMCQANGKLWNDYWRLQNTQEFLGELSAITGIPVIGSGETLKGYGYLVESSVGRYGGTWIHQRAAIHLAQWCSPAFAARVTGWVEELLTKGVVTLYPPRLERAWSSRLDDLVVTFRREMKRRHPGCWSVATEMMTDLLLIEDELFRHGYPLAVSDLPDGSVGKRWSDYRRGKPWALAVANDVPMTTPHLKSDGERMVVYPCAYQRPENDHFEDWFDSCYAPEHLPGYLERKTKRDAPRWLQAGLTPPSLLTVANAADNACVRLTGGHARLTAKLAAAKLLASPGNRQADLFDM